MLGWFFIIHFSLETKITLKIVKINIMETKFYRDRFETTFANEIKMIINDLNQSLAHQQWHYEIVTNQKLIWPVCIFKNQADDSRIWTEDIVNFYTNDDQLMNFDVFSNCKFDGRLLSWTTDQKINQAIMDILGSQFSYRDRFEAEFKKLSNLAYEAQDEYDLIDRLKTWKSKGDSKTKTQAMDI